SEERYYEVSNQTQTHLSVLKDNLINMATKLALQNTILKFRCLASSQKKPHIAHAIRCISDILLAIPAEKAAVQKYFETNEKDLMKHLNCLRWHSVSLGNTALNVVVMALAYGSVVGVLALWMSGYLAKTKAETGGYHMFFKYGEAQQAEILLHQSKLSMGV
ncbi:MAG TPA: hypothetical protein VHD33_06405, partial [Legionellaceae bacterium]|nr:hypothetical protein [Legionellaceae bacterium]